MKYLWISLVAIGLLAGRADASQKVILTVHSNPEGARVVATNVTGVTPLALQYTLPDFKTCHNTEAVTVTWASGATTTLPAIALCPAMGKKQYFTFDRPAGVDGLGLDLQAAYQQAMLTQMQQANATANYAAFLQSLHVAPQLPKTSVLCVTRHVANGVDYVSCQ